MWKLKLEPEASGSKENGLFHCVLRKAKVNLKQRKAMALPRQICGVHSPLQMVAGPNQSILPPCMQQARLKHPVQVSKGLTGQFFQIWGVPLLLPIAGRL